MQDIVKKTIRGQSDLGADDGLHPPEAAVLQSSSTSICSYTRNINK